MLYSMYISLSAKTGLFSLYLWNLPVYGILTLLVIRALQYRSADKGKRDVWDVSIVILMLVIMLMTYGNPQYSTKWNQLPQFILPLLMSFYFRRTYGDYSFVSLLINFAVVTLLVQSVVCLIQIITSSQFGNLAAFFGQVTKDEIKELAAGGGLGQVHGTFGHANTVGNWITFLFPFGVIAPYLTNQVGIKWWINRMALFMGLLVIFLTFSLGNIGILLLVNLAFLPFVMKFKGTTREKAQISKFKILLIIIVLILALFAAISAAFYVDRIFSALTTKMELKGSGSGVNSAAFRVEMMIASVKYFLQHPLVGLGLQNSKYIYSYVDTIIPNWWEYRPHNAYCIMANEGGLFALLAFIIITFLPFFRFFHISFIRKRFDIVNFAFAFSMLSVMAFYQIYVTPLTSGIMPLHIIYLSAWMGYMDRYHPPVKIQTDYLAKPANPRTESRTTEGGI